MEARKNILILMQHQLRKQVLTGTLRKLTRNTVTNIRGAALGLSAGMH